jgi:dihydrofolate reductase
VKISLICAAARNGVIGRDNQLLWRLKSDLRRFRDLTTGKPLIMGRKTFLSIGRPLPNRDNIIVTRDRAFAPPGVIVTHSLAEAFDKAEACAKARGVDEIMIGGGGDIYAQTIDRADRLFMTEVDLDPEGDAVFPPIDRTHWLEIKREQHAMGPDNEAAYSFVDYVRR